MSAKTEKPHGHIVPLSVYVAVGSALFVLTGLTIVVASLKLGGWNAVAAFSIAAVKTALVALFFMHLYYDRKIYLVVLLAGILFLAIFIAFTMFDVLRRGDIYDIAADPIQENAAMYDSRGEGSMPADTLFDSTGAAKAIDSVASDTAH